ncbi:UDP-N-acetylglucosamine 2-epimerase [Cohnella soli]|uniref:UDP-N-acetylglucosamine 2-epimerase n=1 Tax=Cohnella soli TaxID=425005 RepID=A0ABW0HMK4_9BACL
MRTICVITGSRAEYGLLHGLMKEIQTDDDLHLQIVATGMHLSPEFGYTYRQIENDGFVIDAKVEMLLSSDTPTAITKSMGLGLIGFADALSSLRPDLIVVLGDRYEIMVAVQAAMIANIPVAHLHGGESTEGAIDEAIRHSITKMSHLHFTAAEPYRQRVIQLGEQPQRVFNVGAIGLDNIRNLPLLGREDFEAAIDFSLGQGVPSFLVTYHPLTLSKRSSAEMIDELLCALDRFSDARIIFTKPNADTDGRMICQRIDRYVSERSDRCVSFVSMGQLKYLSAIRHVDAVIGNSSSGIIEVPLFKKPTVDIGDRQKGRLKSSSVISCGESADEIEAAIGVALSSAFQAELPYTASLFGSGNVAPQIKEVIKCVELDHITVKKFYDVEL